MADTLTNVLNLVKPEIGASDDTWGSKFNANLDAIDAIFAAGGGGTSVGINVGFGKTMTLGGALNLLASSVVSVTPGAQTPWLYDSDAGYGADKLLRANDKGHLGVYNAPWGTWDSGGGPGSYTPVGAGMAVSPRPYFGTEWPRGAISGGDDFMALTYNAAWKGGNLGAYRAMFTGPSAGVFLTPQYILFLQSAPNTTPGTDTDAQMRWNFLIGRDGNAYSRLSYGLSDLRQKTNLRLIEQPLEKIAALGGYTYDMLEGDGQRVAGVIAQEIEGVLPEAVRQGPEDGLLLVNLAGVVGLLVGAVKELRARVIQLELQ